LSALLTLVFLASTLAQTQTPSDVARWKNEAEHGNAVSQFWLGVAYESGKGVQQDFKEALRWLAKSAHQGNADGQNLMGQMFEEGEGVPVNYVQAAKWYRAACENRPDRGGAGQGCNNLGLLYLDGHGVKPSRVEAYKYFKLCSCSSNLDELKPEMTATEIAEAERQTEKWIKAHPDR
jgi:TPR repeat protein